MALARCDTHGNPQGKTQTYVEAKLPVGYPRSGVICGNPRCSNVAKIWLTAEEAKRYNQGQRIFRPDSNVAAFFVQ